MKIMTTLILSFIIISSVLISGCIQQDTTDTSGGDQLSQQSAEDAALAAVEQEMEDALSEMTLEEIENELLTQG